MDVHMMQTIIQPFFPLNKIPHLNYLGMHTALNQEVYRPRLMHQHENELELHFVLDGSGSYLIGDRERNIKKGDILICNSDQVHGATLDFYKNITTYWVSISNLQLPGLRENCILPDDVCPVLDCTEHFEEITAIFNTMYTRITGSSFSKYKEETCQYLLLSLLSIVFEYVETVEHQKSEKRANAKIICQEMKQYIDDHFFEDLNLTKLSEIFYLNLYYLSHAFKSQVGCSPMQYVMRRRIGEAQTLLETTTDSITKIASSVGYGDPNQFYAIFTKHVGMSPKKYRETFHMDNLEL